MMASALMNGLISSKIASPSSIICSDVYQPSLDKAAANGISTTSSNAEVCNKAKDVIILAVKPHIIPSVCADIAKVEGGSDAVIISIAAGVTLATLEGALPKGARVIRVMPNTPCLIGAAASGYSLGSTASSTTEHALHCRGLVSTIFGSVGLAMEVPSEHLLDAVTGVSGSGPAYVYQFIEALSDGGVRCGLARNVATELAAQTVMGAAKMVLETGKHPGELKDAVTSPGGTTIAGVEALEQGGLRATTISAVKASTRRSMQLGGVSEEDIKSKYNL